KPRRKDNELPHTSVPTSVVDEAVNEEMDNSLERVTTTATSLDAEHDRGGGPRCQEAIGDIVAQTRVLDLETTKTTQAMDIENLKRRVKKLERRKKARTYGFKRLYKVGLSARVESFAYEGLGKKDASKLGRISNIDANEDITLVSTHDEQMFDADQDLGGEREISTTGEVHAEDYFVIIKKGKIVGIYRFDDTKTMILKEQKNETKGSKLILWLLKELKTSRAPKKVLIREEAKAPVTKSVNFISLIREEEEKNDIYDVATGDDSKEINRPNMEVSVKEAETNNGAKSEAKN
nr:hypothetical protein [Tanacetum cinerariifolium]